MSRDGLDHLTTNRIAERAGISIGSLYQYFPNKEALVIEVRRRYEEEFQGRLMGLLGDLSGLSLEQAIRRCVRALIEFHAEDPGLHNAVSTAGLDDAERPVLHKIVASWIESRRDEVRCRNRTLAASVAIDAAEALIHGVARRSPERLADEEFAAEVTDLLVRYLVK